MSDLWRFAAVYAGGSLCCVCAGLCGLWLGVRKKLTVRPAVSAGVLTASIYTLIFQFRKFDAHKNYVDMTAWLEIVHNIILGKGAFCSLERFHPGGGYWLGTHFTPFIYLFAAPAYLFGIKNGLLISQFVLMACALFALYRYAHFHLNSRPLGLAAAACLALLPTFQYISLYEFEMLRFCIAPLILCFVALEKKSQWHYWFFMTAALLIREEVALTTFLLGLYIIWRHNDWWRAGVATSVISIAYFLIVTQKVMPSFVHNAASFHVDTQFFAAFGRSSGEIARSILLHPLSVARLILQPEKAANIFMYCMPFFFLPLLSPAAVVSIANLGVCTLASTNTYSSYFLYYLAPTVAVFSVAMVQGIERLARIVSSRVSIATAREAIMVSVMATAICATVFFGPSPISIQFWIKSYRLAPFRTQNFHRTQYVVSAHDRVLQELVKEIPMTATVSAEQHLLPELFDRAGLQVFPDIGESEYVLIDKLRREKSGVGSVAGSWDGLRQNPQAYYDWVERNPHRWKRVAERDGYALYQRSSEEAIVSTKPRPLPPR